MEVIVRRLVPDDMQAFRSIRLEALLTSPEAFGADHAEQVKLTLEQWAARLEGDGLVLGAFHESRIVGMAGLRRDPRVKTRHWGTIWGVYLSPDARGTGAGRRLMERLIETARTMDGLEHLNLSVVSTNEPARRLYLSLGFQPYGREPRALKVGDRYLDEDLMVLMLHP